MPLRSAFNYYSEIVGCASAMIMLASMGSIVLAATALDVLR